MPKSKVLILNVAISLSILVGGILLYTFFTDNKGGTPASSSNQAQDDAKKYPFLAKRLFVENPSDAKINFSPLRQQLRDYYSEKGLKGSFYFEYLPTGTSVRVNGDTEYRGASLLKIPVAMELFKASETGKINLDEKVTIREDWLDSQYGELYKKGAGYQLTLREAAKIMLEDSDNTALFTIAGNLESKLGEIDRVYDSLDIYYSTTSSLGINIGSRSYSSFLKCLYFSCYNSKGDSQEMLSYLSESKFNNRITAGIEDKNVKVAHKIGVFNTQVQSDCGIVYVENKNYVICIMLEGDNNDVTNGHIVEISRIVYKYVTK